jgi:hypothetical protein
MNNGSQYYNHSSQVTFKAKNPIKKLEYWNHHTENKREGQKVHNPHEPKKGEN